MRALKSIPVASASLRRQLGRSVLLLVAAGAVGSAASANPFRPAGTSQATDRGVRGISTGPNAELRETVPISRRPGRARRSALSLELPRLRRGDRVRFNAEANLTTTCVEPSRRCIGRMYSFSPRIRGWIAIAPRKGASGGKRTRRVSSRVSHTCGQRRPNRNHHCPLVIGRGAISVGKLRHLPCRAAGCRLNMIVTAHHRRARAGNVVVVGADRPDGSVASRHARLSAVLVRSGTRVASRAWKTSRRRVKRIPIGFSGGHRVVYSQRLDGLRAGDVLLLRSKHRTRVARHPHFVGSRLIIASRRRATSPGRFVARVSSRHGTATESNGFNCTIGPSAFRSPCTTKKAGMVTIKRDPTTPSGRPRPLFANLISRGFPKRAQMMRGSYPPLRIVRGGRLAVKRLRSRPPAASRSRGAAR
jgi:hypothetical protein